MKLASLLFFSLLAYAHQASDFDRPLDEPMCAFRDGAQGWLGYALFGAVALIGACYLFTLKRLGQPGEAANGVGAGLLLVVIAATPGEWALHRAGAFVLLGSIYAHYALLLLPGRRPLLALHLSAPLVLAVATGFGSYGLWQKGMISYLVVVALVHHHAVKRRAREVGSRTPLHMPTAEDGHGQASFAKPPLGHEQSARSELFTGV